ncbi:MAG: SIMPL domain-containing protein [bacterium]
MPFEHPKAAPGHSGKFLLMIVLGLSAIVWLWADVSLKSREMLSVGKEPQIRHTITISAEGKVVTAPDIATLQVGLITEGTRVAEVQAENSKKFNAVLELMKGVGVKEEDLKTSSYNLSPKYDYEGGKSILAGYIIDQQVQVKIRDLSLVNAVLDKAGQSGANSIGGLNFTLDNRETVENQARVEAIAKAKDKAVRMSREAGFKLGKLVNFSESENGPVPQVYYEKALLSSAVPAPEIQSGALEITKSVSLTYEIE